MEKDSLLATFVKTFMSLAIIFAQVWAVWGVLLWMKFDFTGLNHPWIPWYSLIGIGFGYILLHSVIVVKYPYLDDKK